MRSALLVLFFMVTAITHAQTANWQWVKSAGRYDSHDKAYAVAVDPNGNSYVTGEFQDSIDFGSYTLVNNGTYNSIMYITKYDPQGNVIWAKTMGGSNESVGKDICTDAGGNFYITGNFHGSIDFGGTTFNTSNLGSMFVAKFDSSGNALWAHNATCFWSNEGRGIALDPEGNVFVAGIFEDSTLNFGSGISIQSVFSSDCFLAKYDNNGNILWAIGGGGSAADLCNDVAVDKSGNAYVTGEFRTSMLFGNITLTANNSGAASAFVIKVDPTGNVLWGKNAGLYPSSGTGNSISVDGFGNSYATGFFNSPIIIFQNDTLYNAGADDIYIVKYDSTGNVTWTKGIGGVNYDQGKGIVSDYNGNIYVTGMFKLNVSFGTIHMTGTNGEIFVVEYDSSGTALWGLQSTGALNELSNNIALDENNYVYIAGDFSSPYSTFGPITLTNSDQFLGSYDMLLAKINVSPVGVFENSLSQFKSTIFPNPVVDRATITFKNPLHKFHTLEIYNANGQLIRSVSKNRSEQFQFEKQGLNAGLYFFRITNEENESSCGKIIIE